MGVWQLSPASDWAIGTLATRSPLLKHLTSENLQHFCRKDGMNPYHKRSEVKDWNFSQVGRLDEKTLYNANTSTAGGKVGQHLGEFISGVWDCERLCHIVFFFFFLFYNDVLQCCHIVLWPSPNTPVRPHSGAEVSSCKVSTPDVPHINVTRKRHLFCVSRINTIKYTSHLGDRKCTNTDSVSVNLDLCSSGIDPKRNNEVKVLTLSFRVVWGCSRF